MNTHTHCVSVGSLLGKCDYGFVSFIVNGIWCRREYTDTGIAVVLKYRVIQNDNRPCVGVKGSFLHRISNCEPSIPSESL